LQQEDMMSNINFEWLKENLKNEQVIFDIGCADMYDTIILKNEFPQNKIFAFECSRKFSTQNIQKAKKYDITYFDGAVGEYDGKTFFYPSKSLRQEDWPWSGSTLQPTKNLLTSEWEWDQPYEVDTISLNLFCERHSIIPDFIHIDAQGAEYSIFKSLKHEYRPKIIWTEISEFQNYASGVTADDFYVLMKTLGYKEHHRAMHDSLFVLDTYDFTEYTEKR
jgi:FkbM family methyltransferase